MHAQRNNSGLSYVPRGTPNPMLIIYTCFNASTILFMCFIKNVQQKFEGIMFCGIYLYLGQAILTIVAYSTSYMLPSHLTTIEGGGWGLLHKKEKMIGKLEA